MDDGASGLFLHAPRLGNPVAKAVAAKAGETHEVDIRRIVAVTQQPHQPAKGGRGHSIFELVERIGGGGLVFTAGHRTYLSITGLNSYTAVALARSTRHAAQGP